MTDAEDALRRSLVPLYRGQHNVVLVERTADAVGSMTARVQPVIQRYEQRGTLTGRQARAAARVYEAWALGICGARDSDKGTGAYAGQAGYADAQMAAAQEYRLAQQAVGHRLFPVIYAVACEDISAEAWAKQRGMDRKGALALLRVGLDMIADELAGRDG